MFIHFFPLPDATIPWRTCGALWSHLFIANAANVGLDNTKEGKCRSTT